VTLFSRFRPQPSGNIGSKYDTLRLLFHDANWREPAESKTSSTDALPTHYVLAGVELRASRS